MATWWRRVITTATARSIRRYSDRPQRPGSSRGRPPGHKSSSSALMAIGRYRMPSHRDEIDSFLGDLDDYEINPPAIHPDYLHTVPGGSIDSGADIRVQLPGETLGTGSSRHRDALLSVHTV